MREHRIVEAEFELVRGPLRRRSVPAWLQDGPARIGPMEWASHGRMLLFLILVIPVLVAGGLIAVFSAITWVRLRLP